MRSHGLCLFSGVGNNCYGVRFSESLFLWISVCMCLDIFQHPILSPVSKQMINYQHNYAEKDLNIDKSC